jgi:16S rRNA (guanine966-N2)-methyltransferase
MRVIAGRFKGRRLASPDWSGLRPTSDRLKGTLFEILGLAVPGARVLDGFAGTGALGIEALSRGAAEAVFVDVDRRAINLIAQNIERCGLHDGYTVIRGSLAGVLGRRPAGGSFDVVLLDPPYDAITVPAILEMAGGHLAAAGVMVLEHARRRAAPSGVPGLILARQVVSGDSSLTFYRPAVPGGATIGAATGGVPGPEE